MATTILPVDIDEAIAKIEKAGGKVSRETHVIYVRSTAKLTNDRYPLSVLESDNLPDGVDAMVAEIITRDEEGKQ